jgi:predicted nucleotide-binding protein
MRRAERVRRVERSPEVHPALAAKLASRLNFTPRHINRLISSIASERHLTRQQAAIVLAGQNRVNVSQWSAPEDLAAIRSAGGFNAPVVVASAPVAPSTRGKSGTRVKKEPGNSVFVVHGRDEAVRRDLFQFLRDLGLNPIEWNAGKRLTKKASPYNAEVINAIIRKAAGAVVLFCPEEQATLKPQYRRSGDPAEERRTNEQPRPNVLYEAGMAFAAFPASTVVVHVGRIRHFTDLAGVQYINLTGGTSQGRQAVASALQTARLPVDTDGQDWIQEGGFTLKAARGKSARSKRSRR